MNTNQIKDLEGTVRFAPILCPLCNLIVNCNKDNLLHDMECYDCMNYREYDDGCMLDLMVANEYDKNHCECTEHDLRKALYFATAELNVYIETLRKDR